MTRELAVELAQHNITVNAIAPGYFATEMNTALIENANFGPRCTADAAGLARAWWQRITGHLMCGLRHAVGLDHWCAERLFELVKHTRRHGC